MINFQLLRKLFKWEILIEKIFQNKLKASLSLVTVVVVLVICFVLLFVCDDVRKQEIKYNKMPHYKERSIWRQLPTEIEFKSEEVSSEYLINCCCCCLILWEIAFFWRYTILFVFVCRVHMFRAYLTDHFQVTFTCLPFFYKFPRQLFFCHRTQLYRHYFTQKALPSNNFSYISF